MQIVIDEHRVFLATGGRAHRQGAQTLIFLHGSGQSHLSWVLQTRYFAYDGFNIIAPDFPGHGGSAGPPLTSITDMADWVIKLMDSLCVPSATLIGHSQGCLIGLVLGSAYPKRVDKLALMAAALAIPVHETLLAHAAHHPHKAIHMMTGWGHGPQGHIYEHSQPGISHLGMGRALMARNEAGALLADLNACNQYDKGAEHAAAIKCPSLIMLSSADKMTPIKKGREMAAAIAHAKKIEIKGAGHMLPCEYPHEVNHALTVFFADKGTNHHE